VFGQFQGLRIGKKQIFCQKTMVKINVRGALKVISKISKTKKTTAGKRQEVIMP
jgi:hypothetical protein